MTYHHTFTLPTSVNFDLPVNTIHVWCAQLTGPEEQIQLLKQNLSEDELERAARFHFPKHRERFIICRGILRVILGAYLAQPPAEVKFVYGENGKPALAEIPGTRPLCFNLSHSSELALYALIRDGELGVDVELIRSVPEARQIARRSFSATECGYLDTVEQLLPETFFECWTRKEAYIKATGLGLSVPLNEFDVSVSPLEPARILNIKGDTEKASRWSLYALRPQRNYVGALAIHGFHGELSCWQWLGSERNSNRFSKLASLSVGAAPQG